MDYVKQIDTCDYFHAMYDELLDIIRDHKLDEEHQISLTSMEGNDDWLCSVGKLYELQHKEKFYSNINKSLQGSKIHQLISSMPNFYRWRAMLMSPGHAYSVHKDGQPNVTNVRCHIPLITNDQANLMFFGKNLYNKKPVLYHLECGNVYEVNTTDYHTAVNFGSHDRWHIVGVRYEDSNYWT